MSPISGQFHADRPKRTAERIAERDLFARLEREATLRSRLIQPPP